jgi:DinB family protein
MRAKAHSIALVACGGIVLSLFARPLASPDPSAPTITRVLDDVVSSVEKLVVGVAEAMPEEKYGFVPTNGEFAGVMSFGAQIKHIADDTYAACGTILTEKHPAGPAGTSKADLVTYLRDAFAFAHRAIATITPENAVAPIANHPGETRLGAALFVIRHGENHYGQTVEYLRMNAIVPPASRPQTSRQ